VQWLCVASKKFKKCNKQQRKKFKGAKFYLSCQKNSDLIRMNHYRRVILEKQLNQHFSSFVIPNLRGLPTLKF
jgi:hypothetical protein